MRELHGLRITFVAGTLGQGGAERQLFYILQALQQSGAEPRVLCLTRGEFWEERIRALGVDVTYAGARASRVARLAFIVDALRARRPHVVQSQHFYTNLYAALAARALRLPEIGAIRNDTVSEVRANGPLLGTWSLKLPRVVAANSRLGIANAVALGVPRTRTRFLPNVVDTEQFAPVSANANANASASAHEEPDDTVHLLAAGRLTEQKRMDRFLRVVAALQSGPRVPVRATIAGAGPLRRALETQAAALGLAPPVLEFVGAVSDMQALYRTAHVLVLTSEWEGTPNVVLEAMASGLAVVSTRVGGVPDIVQHEATGLLIDGQDDAVVERDLCAAIRSLAEDPERRRALGAGARDFVVQQHSVQALPRFLGELYTSVLS